MGGIIARMNPSRQRGDSSNTQLPSVRTPRRGHDASMCECLTGDGKTVKGNKSFISRRKRFDRMLTNCIPKWVGEEIPATEPKCPEVYYDAVRQCYWIENTRHEWISVNESSLRRLLRKHGFSSKRGERELLSPLDLCVCEIQTQHDVAYAGPLSGRDKGFVELCGQRILVTTSAKLIKPREKPYPTLEALLTKMLGEEQFRYFKAWLKIAYEALEAGVRRPGQMLVLAGPRDSYKSLMQNLITEILGGRSAKPYRYMSGATDFNGDLFGAEHLMIEDDIASCDIRARRNFGARIKDFTVNEVQSCHAKNRQAISLKPFWRVSVSVNDEPENLLILPPLDDSIKDKLLLLKVQSQPPIRRTVTLEERSEFWRTLLDELPGFVWALKRWDIPAQIQGGRFGVLHFHHPDLLQAINDSAPETKLLALIDAAMKQKIEIIEGNLCQTTVTREGSGMPGARWLCTAELLERTISEQYPNEARRLFTWQNAAGIYLGRLADKYPQRVRQHRTANERLWIVEPPVTA